MNEGDEVRKFTLDSTRPVPPSVEAAFESSALNLEETKLGDLIESAQDVAAVPVASQHRSLKHHLLGPSLTKAGQDTVDQKKVAEVIYEASKGSKFFNNEEVKDHNLSHKIDRILKLKSQLEKLDLKADLKRAENYIAELELSRDLSQYVVHIDCDAFYAAVEEIDRPELKNVPMAVGQGVLTTCNYEARKYGCRSAMAGFVAKKLCPQLICLPLNFDKYTAKAKEVRAILATYDPQFESSSIDEAYLNITEYCESSDLSPEEAITQLRNEVAEKCKITISAGIAPNAKIAKICSNKNKPNGQFRIPNDRIAVMSFIRDLPVRKVNGIGRVLERELDAIGVKTCGDIYEYRAYLNRLFGEKTYQFLLQTYLGLGRTNVQPAEDYERKSVGTESTFRDMSLPSELRTKLRHTAEELEKDMKRVGVKGRTLCLKIKLHTYEVFTRQIIPPKAVAQADDLYGYALPMLAKLEKEMPNLRIRLMGLRCTHLVSTKKPDVDGFFAKKTNPSMRAHSTDEAGEWEEWPDSEFEQAARQEQEAEFEEIQKLSQEHEAAAMQEQGDIDHTLSTEQAVFSTKSPSNVQEAKQADWSADWHEPFGRYKFGSAPNTPSKAEKTALLNGSTTSQAETWDCPICGSTLPANDRDFNEHIDLCLNRTTIRDAVAETSNTKANLVRSESAPSRPSSATGTKRKAAAVNVDHPHQEANVNGKQRKLFFA